MVVSNRCGGSLFRVLSCYNQFGCFMPAMVVTAVQMCSCNNLNKNIIKKKSQDCFRVYVLVCQLVFICHEFKLTHFGILVWVWHVRLRLW